MQNNAEKGYVYIETNDIRERNGIKVMRECLGDNVDG